MAEQEARQKLLEARAREGQAAQRLSTEAARVHTLELMRLNGAELHVACTIPVACCRSRQ